MKFLDQVKIYIKAGNGGDGSPSFNMQTTAKKTKGTDVILHIADDSKEFLEESRLSGILNKYCKFLPVSIKFGTKTEKIDDPKGKKDKEGNIEKIDKVRTKINFIRIENNL